MVTLQTKIKIVNGGIILEKKLLDRDTLLRMEAFNYVEIILNQAESQRPDEPVLILIKPILINARPRKAIHYFGAWRISLEIENILRKHLDWDFVTTNTMHVAGENFIQLYALRSQPKSVTPTGCVRRI